MTVYVGIITLTDRYILVRIVTVHIDRYIRVLTVYLSIIILIDIQLLYLTLSFEHLHAFISVGFNYASVLSKF